MCRSILACFIVTLLAPMTALAHTPEEKAARCVRALEQILERNRSIAAEQTRECVRHINALQAQGNDDAAIRVARQCIASARERTANASALAKRICNACIEELIRLGEPQLARRVNHKCESVTEELRMVLQRQTHAIQKALND